ncbi:hypothetical protein [Paenibacillus antarcticus]|uniref:Uncharacterized protein n=1 Tax=Paenibacillus antarcticus TaxID=253703 RepID=A0A168J8G8_9BACL|nr:hypothetical protein [Paenibacillus antarcticus]OAB40282.1 hypothetical protein PBAT_23540 [Paenibacillus antarcticus]
MNSDKELQELKERLAKVEGQLQQKSKFSSGLRFVIGFIIVFVVFLVVIGVVQFMSNSSV